jgi:microcystin-dependent protein
VRHYHVKQVINIDFKTNFMSIKFTKKQSFKTGILIFALLCTVQCAFSQNDPLYINGDGNVGIGGPTGSNEKLTVNGNVKTNGNIVASGNIESNQNLSVTGNISAKGRVRDKTGIIMPVGSVIAFAGEKVPDGWLFCDGSGKNVNDYKDLFDAIGYSWGNPGGNQFNLPDLRGYFLRGVSRESSADPDKNSRTSRNNGNSGNKVGSYQNDDFARHSHGNGEYNKLVKTSKCGEKVTFKEGDDIGCDTEPDIQKCKQMSDAGGNETRPKNANVNYIIKY